MGNYAGTVRCGHCYQRGHNKAGCPKRKERVEKLRETDPGNWQVQRADQEREARVARAKKPRTCTYCKANRKTVSYYRYDDLDDAEKNALVRASEDSYDDWIEKDTLYGTGSARGLSHSIRACKYRKRDLAEATESTAKMRQAILERMKATGLGLGAGIDFAEDSHAASSYGQGGQMVVTGIQWDRITSVIESSIHNQELVDLTNVRYLMSHNKPYDAVCRAILPNNVTGSDTQHSRYSEYIDRVAHPVSAEKIDSQVPDGWLEATSDATQSFIGQYLDRNVKSRHRNN